MIEKSRRPFGIPKASVNIETKADYKDAIRPSLGNQEILFEDQQNVCLMSTLKRKPLKAFTCNVYKVS